MLKLKKKHRIAVAWAQDTNTIGAISKAVKKGFIEAMLIGDPPAIKKICGSENIDFRKFTIIESANEARSAAEAVRLAKTGEADIVMKGLVGTDKFLKAVMDKENGLCFPMRF